MSIFRFSTGRDAGGFNGFIRSHACGSAPSEFIRGGRLRKTSRGLASFAPFLAGASTLALGALLATASPAEAGNCPDSGQIRECSGVLDTTNDETETIAVGAGESLTLTTTDDFGLRPSGKGIVVTSTDTTGDISLTIAGLVSTSLNAIEVDQDGPGDVEINVRPLTTTSGHNIFVSTAAGSGDVEVTTALPLSGSGGLEAGDDSIHIDHDGIGSVSVTTGSYVQVSSGTSGHGIHIDTASTSDALTLDINGAVTAAGANMRGININHDGSGRLTLTTAEGSVIDTDSNGGSGIFLYSDADAEIVLNGDIGASGDRIEAHAVSATVQDGGELDLTINGDIYTQASTFNGVIASGGGDTSRITIDGKVEGGLRGLQALNSEADRLVIRLGDDAEVVGGTGIEIDGDKADAETVVYLGGTVTGRDGGAAIIFGEGSDHHLGDKRVVITANKDYTLTGLINAGTEGGVGIIEINAPDGASDEFSLSTQLNEQFTNFRRIEKTGSGTFNIIGDQDIDHNLNHVTVSEGTAILNTDGDELTFQDANSGFTIAQGATLEIVELVQTRNTAESAAGFNLNGTLHLRDADARLTLNKSESVFTASGTGRIIVDVDLGQTNDLFRFTAQGDVMGTIPVQVNLIGALPELEEEEEVRVDNLLRIRGSAQPDSFVLDGTASASPFDLEFEHSIVTVDAGTYNQWALVVKARVLPGIDEALYETLPATLAQLARLESHHIRLAGRQYTDNMAVWGKIMGASSEVEPNSTSLATYDIENAEVEFGMSFPLNINNPDIDGDFALGAATTDISVPDADGEIATDFVAVGISVGWEDERAYFDGQFQYAGFDNVIEADQKLADIDANAFSASAEVGYSVELARLNAAFLGDLPDIAVIPSAQLQWSRIDFKDFTANETAVKLDRGSVINGRVGFAVEGQAQGMLLHGRTNVIVPLDGEVGVNVADTPLTSEREDPVFDIGIGAAYEWDGAYAISADVSTQQGSDVEGYAAKVGFRYEF